MSKTQVPYVIDFQQIGKEEIGYISVSEIEKQIPFEVKRVFWTYKTPKNITRGKHAHHTNKEILVAVNGTITISTETKSGEKSSFTLNNPNQGLFLPSNLWFSINYSDDAIQLVLASENYDQNDYIRDFNDYKS